MRPRSPFILIAALVLPLVVLTALAHVRPSVADAHPLGNFTVNRYSRIELYSDAVRIRYVLDMAEIPAFQEIESIDRDGDGQPSPGENEAYLSTKSRELAANLTLTNGGSPAPLELLSSHISYPEGQAGLRTLRLTMLLNAPLASTELDIKYHDANFSDRVGWKEIVVLPAPGATIFDSTAPSEELSQELTKYPDDLLTSPLNVTTASVSADLRDAALAPALTTNVAAANPDSAPERPGAGFASLIDTDNLTLPVMLLSLLLALGFGAVHALEPGHGKTFVAAYFVGVKGTARQALSLGLIIAATHTVGVLAIGAVALFGSRFILPGTLYPWLSLASGVMILALGVRLIATRVGAGRFFAALRDRGRGHDHPHGHSHEPPEAGAPPWKSLLALGLADGLTPSPSALVVLLAAVSLDRIGLGLLLVAAFSVGLAAVLTLVCLSLIYARRFLDWLGDARTSLDGASRLGWIAVHLRAEDGLLRIAPLAGAFALVAIGLVLTVRALTQPGLPL